MKKLLRVALVLTIAIVTTNIKETNTEAQELTIGEAIELIEDPYFKECVLRNVSDLSRPASTQESMLCIGLSGPISSIEGIQYFPNLLQIDLIDPTLIVDLTPIASLENLVFLDIYYSEISDISMLSSLQALTHLQISNSNISDITVVHDMPNLVLFTYYGNQVTDYSQIRECNCETILNPGVQEVNIEVVRSVDNTYEFRVIDYDGELLDGSEFMLLTDNLVYNNDGTFTFEASEYPTSFSFEIDRFYDAEGDFALIDLLVNITILDDEVPVITGNDTTFKEGTSFDLSDLTLFNLSAIDNEDGDLTPQLELINDGGLLGDGTDVAGVYTLTYQVTDSFGNVSTFDVAVTIDAAPTLSVNDMVVTEGTAFDLMDFSWNGLVALDNEDGDVASAVVVIDNGGLLGDGTDAPGLYIISYQVTDLAGNVTTVVSSITIEPDTSETIDLPDSIVVTPEVITPDSSNPALTSTGSSDYFIYIFGLLIFGFVFRRSVLK